MGKRAERLVWESAFILAVTLYFISNSEHPIFFVTGATVVVGASVYFIVELRTLIKKALSGTLDRAAILCGAFMMLYALMLIFTGAAIWYIGAYGLPNTTS